MVFEEKTIWLIFGIIAIISSIFKIMQIQKTLKKKSPEISFANLDDELSNNLKRPLKEFALKLVKEVQAVHTNDEDIIINSTIDEIESFGYSTILGERDYELIYKGNQFELDKLFDELSAETKMELNELSEHIEEWSKAARIAEVVIVNEIARAFENLKVSV